MANESPFSKYKALFVSLIILLLFILILVIYFVGNYNKFVTLDQDVNSKWSEVENQYQRQSDLIPNLVSTVSSAVRVETRFVTDVTEARSRWQTSKTLFEKDTAGAQMNNGITALVNAIATAENYPQLQANKQYIALTDELSGTQNRISVSRTRYIESIQKYNTAIKRFPGNLLANLYGFIGKDYYKAELNALQTPQLGTGQLP